MDLLLKNIQIISPDDNVNEVTDLLIIDGIIEKIGNTRRKFKNAKELDLKNKTCVPGFFDMHVHFREPGQTHKEDLLTGSIAAANGGFTGVLCMPNTHPPIDSPLLVKNLLDKSKDFLVNIYVAACATLNREGERLAPIFSLHDAGAVAFTDDGSPIWNSEMMRRVLEYTSQINSVVIQHCEDMILSNKGVMNEGYNSTTMGVKGIPEVSETTIIARDILIAEFVKNSNYHIQHISCGGSVELLRKAKEKNLNVTGEVCPHHFILTDEECLNYNTYAKINPPLRTKRDVDEILAGLMDDTIDVICTDHAPHTEYEKSQGFYDSPFGIIGLESIIGLTYTYLVKKEIISFEKMIEKMSINPRKILGLDKIKIREGERANLTILDKNKKWKINKNKFKSASKNTLFDNYEVQCKPFCVINNKQIYYSNL